MRELEVDQERLRDATRDQVLGRSRRPRNGRAVQSFKASLKAASVPCSTGFPERAKLAKLPENVAVSADFDFIRALTIRLPTSEKAYRLMRPIFLVFLFFASGRRSPVLGHLIWRVGTISASPSSPAEA